MVDAHPREPLVDLDRPAPPRPAIEPGERLRGGLRRLRAARLQVSAVALAAVLGAVAGGAGVHRWEAGQERAAAAAVVEVGAQLIDPADLDGTSDGTTASMVANLTLVNLGPLPIEVEDLGARRQGLEIRNASQRVTIRPGFRTIAVTITFTCAQRTVFIAAPLPLNMWIRTADGATRTVDTTVEISPGARWPRSLEQRCRD
ncbi:hypothetical protein [Asanoa siamensis]|uniref:LEA14-like dessication related protein n=1 Tax=Asanoa siamensis TaxID=926357 RepID=A0ABQ4CYJ4_9ACTN|nr:hypothetical protein [Asanoa siamensis]GIF76073.1 hypothetical protein Asi02nite_55910 [Asanoa siamensis]